VRRLNFIKYQFVEFIPDNLEDGTIYISVEYATAIHKCCCGCQSKVVTPFGRNAWKLTYDGDAVSLNPSIGNYQFQCRSHYWIQENKVIWLPDGFTIHDDNYKGRKDTKKKRWFDDFFNRINIYHK
jgi:hypothetical protein